MRWLMIVAAAAAAAAKAANSQLYTKKQTCNNSKTTWLHFAIHFLDFLNI